MQTHLSLGRKKKNKMSLLSPFNCNDPEERKESGLRSAEILLRKFLQYDTVKNLPVCHKIQ